MWDALELRCEPKNLWRPGEHHLEGLLKQKELVHLNACRPPCNTGLPRLLHLDKAMLVSAYCILSHVAGCVACSLTAGYLVPVRPSDSQECGKPGEAMPRRAAAPDQPAGSSGDRTIVRAGSFESRAVMEALLSPERTDFRTQHTCR